MKLQYVNTGELEKLGLKVEEDGVYVVKSENVDSLNAEALEEKLLEIGILDAPYELITQIRKRNPKKPVKVCNTVVEFDPLKSDYVRVTVSRDALEAYLDVTFPSTGEEITERDIKHRLFSAGVVHNIDEEKIKQIVRNKIFVEKEIIAVGEEPIIGEEAQIVLEVDTEVSSEPLVKDDGSVDFKQISMLKTVEKDQLLAVKIPATKGQDGCDVRGRVIDSTGVDRSLPVGKNTYISDDELSLYASLSGRILYERERMIIENILAIHGDIDFTTGNIEFTGDIAISGDVLTGFKVKTEGDIRIRGVVEGAEIISTKGNINIGRGVVGQDKARLIAAHDVRAEFINEATIEAGNDVSVGEYIMNSIVSADNEVRATEGRGSIIGGKIYSEKSIEAKAIGSSSNIKTEVKVGGRIEGALYEKMLIIERDEEVLERAENTMKKEIEFIELLKKKLPKFPESKNKELKELQVKLKKIQDKKKNVLKKKKELSKEFRVMISEAQKKIAANTIHRNVLVSIDQSKMLTEFTYKTCMIYSKDGEMKISYQSRYA